MPTDKDAARERAMATGDRTPIMVVKFDKTSRLAAYLKDGTIEFLLQSMDPRQDSVLRSYPLSAADAAALSTMAQAAVLR